MLISLRISVSNPYLGIHWRDQQRDNHHGITYLLLTPPPYFPPREPVARFTRANARVTARLARDGRDVFTCTSCVLSFPLPSSVKPSLLAFIKLAPPLPQPPSNFRPATKLLWHNFLFCKGRA